MKNIIFDMETGDPDDVLTLLLLLGHPQVNLKAVTVTPGTPHQIAVVRDILRRFGEEDLPLGAFNLDHKKARGTKDERYVTCVSGWHWKFLGELEPSREAEAGWKVLLENLDASTILLTGAPVKNLGGLLRRITPDIKHAESLEVSPDFQFQWVAQGGFAGEGVVPEDNILPKFRGMKTCPTYNLNGDPKSALLGLESAFISQRIFVSKNVCHGVIYGLKMHRTFAQRIQQLPESRQKLSLQLMYKGMDKYLAKKASGKAFHDPLAACCAINPEIGQWKDVILYREKGKWGSRIAMEEQANGKIIIGYDHELFLKTMLDNYIGF